MDFGPVLYRSTLPVVDPPTEYQLNVCKFNVPTPMDAPSASVINGKWRRWKGLQPPNNTKKIYRKEEQETAFALPFVWKTFYLRRHSTFWNLTGRWLSKCQENSHTLMSHISQMISLWILTSKLYYKGNSGTEKNNAMSHTWKFKKRTHQ